MRKSKISESIFDGLTVIIPLAEVQYIEKRYEGEYYDVLSLQVVTGTTKGVTVKGKDVEKFLKAWLFYRHEIDGPFKSSSDKSEKSRKFNILKLKNEGLSNVKIAKGLSTSQQNVGQIIRRAITNGLLKKDGQLSKKGEGFMSRNSPDIVFS